MPYPTDQDVKDFLYGAGLVASPPTGASATWAYGKAATAGRRRVENAAGRVFVAAASYAKEFDAPVNRGRRLHVPAFTAITSITYLGTAIQASEYLAGPLNAADASPLARPFEYIDFFREWWAPVPWAQRAQLVVTATWAYASDVPDDVFQATCMAAGLSLWPQLVALKTRGMTAWQEAGVSQSYGATPFQSIKDDWEAEIDRIIGQYRDWGASIF